MKKLRNLLILGIIVISGLSKGFGMGHEVVNRDDFSLNIGGRIQEVAYGQLIHDPYANNGRLYLFLKQARFRVNGKVDDVKYDMQWVGAAEDVNGSNNGLTLLDASFDVPLFNWDSTYFKVGQFKVPYGREAINEDGSFQFVDRSIDYLGFNLGRDYGAAIHTYRGKFVGGLGIFTGGGRDVPLRFLPERLGLPMMVLRVGYNDGLDKDLFTVEQNDLSPSRTTKSTYLNAMYLKDTRIGHSTVLNVRTSEKSILMNPNWNPYLNRIKNSATTTNVIDRGALWQLGWDAAARGPLGHGSWSTEIEANYAQFENIYGKIHINGARAQGAIAGKHLEFALRYALMTLDDNLLTRTASSTGDTAAYRADTTGTKISNGRPMQEVTPAITYYIKGHDHKIVLDFPVLINVPIFIENTGGNKDGAYVGPEQLDQVTVTAGGRGRLEYQTVTEARIMYQLAF